MLAAMTSTRGCYGRATVIFSVAPLCRSQQK